MTLLFFFFAFGHLVNLVSYSFLLIAMREYCANDRVRNDTEKISMAPALRMTRSIKEKLPIFLFSLRTVLVMVVKKKNIWAGLSGVVIMEERTVLLVVLDEFAEIYRGFAVTQMYTSNFINN